MLDESIGWIESSTLSPRSIVLSTLFAAVVPMFTVETRSLLNLANPKDLPPACVLPLLPGRLRLRFGICMLGTRNDGIAGTIPEIVDKLRGGWLQEKTMQIIKMAKKGRKQCFFTHPNP